MSEDSTTVAPGDDAGLTNAERTAREAEYERRIEEAQRQYKRVVAFTDDEYGLLLFHKPKPGDMKRFIADVTDDDADDHAAADNLALACVIEPPRAQFAPILDDLSGLGTQVANELLKLARAGGKARVKKLGKR